VVGCAAGVAHPQRPARPPGCRPRCRRRGLAIGRLWTTKTIGDRPQLAPPVSGIAQSGLHRSGCPSGRTAHAQFPQQQGVQRLAGQHHPAGFARATFGGDWRHRFGGRTAAATRSAAAGGEQRSSSGLSPQWRRNQARSAPAKGKSFSVDPCPSAAQPTDASHSARQSNWNRRPQQRQRSPRPQCDSPPSGRG